MGLVCLLLQFALYANTCSIALLLSTCHALMVGVRYALIHIRILQRCCLLMQISAARSPIDPEMRSLEGMTAREVKQLLDTKGIPSRDLYEKGML
jgi:uncharacterized protein (UPF0179 family)